MKSSATDSKESHHQSSTTEILGGYYIKMDGRYLECDCGNDRFIVTANGTLCLKCTKEWFLGEPKSKQPTTRFYD